MEFVHCLDKTEDANFGETQHDATSITKLFQSNCLILLCSDSLFVISAIKMFAK